MPRLASEGGGGRKLIDQAIKDELESDQMDMLAAKCLARSAIVMKVAIVLPP